METISRYQVSSRFLVGMVLLIEAFITCHSLIESGLGRGLEFVAVLLFIEEVAVVSVLHLSYAGKQGVAWLLVALYVFRLVIALFVGLQTHTLLMTYASIVFNAAGLLLAFLLATRRSSNAVSIV